MKMYRGSVNERFIDEIVAALRDGAMIVYPTDTRYAVGCDAMNNRAVERVCALKNVDPKRNTLAITCADMSQASEYARIDNISFKILRDAFPGPYTFILQAANTLPKVFKGRRQVGIRIPDDDIARAIAAALGNPLLTTTVEWDNDEGDACLPEAIADRYKHLGVEMVIDAGECDPTPSTVIDLTDPTDPQIIREGKGQWPLTNSKH